MISAAAFLMLAAAADPRAAALSVYAKAQKAVIGVRVVVKMSVGGRDREQKEESVGTVIDPSGLTVIPASAADPGEMVQAMLRARPELHLETTVTGTTMILPDGTEVDAEVILKDSDLDIALVRPRTPPARPMDAVEPKGGKALPQVLDEVILVGRYGRSLNRTAWVALAHVHAIVKGPRPFAVFGGEAAHASGTVAYGPDGAPLGILTTHYSKDAEGMERIGGSAVILRPFDDLTAAIEQARKAPASAPAAK